VTQGKVKSGVFWEFAHGFGYSYMLSCFLLCAVTYVRKLSVAAWLSLVWINEVSVSECNVH